MSGPISEASGSLATMVTTGGGFVLGKCSTLMLTGAETLDAPWSSVAFAVNVYSPATTFDQTSTNGPSGLATGRFVFTPRLFEPEKNSTVSTLPWLSSACATIASFAGSRKIEPFRGLTIRTCGGGFVTSPLSAMFTTALLGEPTR